MSKTDELLRDVRAIAARPGVDLQTLKVEVVARIRTYEQEIRETYSGEFEAETKRSSYMSDLRDRMESTCAALAGSRAGDVVDAAVEEIWPRRKTS